MERKEELKRLLSQFRPSEVVVTLAEICEEKSKSDKENDIGWVESASALWRAYEHIAGYGM